MSLVYLELVPRDRDEFGRKVEAIASRLGINANWLMIVMRFETAGKFLPGNYASSGAVGLIQFTTAGASKVGTTKAYLATLTAIQQLDWVEKYFVAWNAKGRMKSLEDVYTIVFAPAYLGRDPATVIYRAGTDQYKANAALDSQKKGYITLADVQSVIRRYVPNGYVDSAPAALSLGVVLALAGGFWFFQHRKKQTEE